MKGLGWLSTTRMGGVQRLVSAIQALCLLNVVLAERFHQRRDHLDQERYLNVHNDNVVKDRDDAEFVLSKYGYLRCQIKRRKREAHRQGRGRHYSAASPGHDSASSQPTPWGGGEPFMLSEEGGLDECDESEVQKAIQEYQRTYNLAPTGVLDEETKMLMSTSRCGNKDNEKEAAAGAAAAAVAAAAAAATTTAASSNPHPTQPSSSSSSSSSSQDNNNNNNVDISSSSSSGSSSGHHQQYHQFTDSNKSGGGVGASQRLWKRAVNRIRKEDSSQLLRLLKKGASAEEAALARHRRHLQEYIRKLPRDPQLLKPWTEEEHQRSKRSIQVTSTGDVGDNDLMNMVSENREPGLMEEQQQDINMEMFNKDVIRWRLLNTGYSTRIPVEDQRATVDLAFRMWSEVIPLRFIEDTESHINRVDIEVAFGRGSHQNCEHDFDGNGGEIAHSQHTANMHFDDEENFKSISAYTPDGIYLLRVAVHEIGHVLGLSHTNRSQSIMYAIYHGSDMSPDFELSRQDRTEIQKIYGKCKGQFSTVFDWVRRRPDNQFIYNTYFFRENHYWMYENHANRTRYGDPLYIAREWDGVPNKLDGYLHIWYFTGTEIVNEAYFFKEDHYFKYDNDNDRVYEGWPRPISDGFGPKLGQSEGIPNNIDSAFFDMRDKNIYFFKDDMVYVFDPKAPPESRGCCERKRRITEEFPPASENDRPLPDRLDAVYYSYSDKMMYFIQGENLWRNRVFDPRQRRIVNSVEFLGKWYDKWLDICDVQAQ